MSEKSYDLIIIGGGATGSGLALDASLRGYKTLLLEKHDFANGTSSKSTKLVHGGVRYLEKAVLNLSKSQYDLVKEGLKERSYFLNNASHLANPIQIITPIYSYFEAFYVYAGLFLYDFIAGKNSIGKCTFLNRKQALKKQPFIKKNKLVGAVSYFDGTFNDTRMVVSLLKSAKDNGCEVKNYCEVKSFLYENNKISGLTYFDESSNKIKHVYAKTIINAAGTAVDKISTLDNENHKGILTLTSGIHLVLSQKYLPLNKALLIPKTDDGRVIFIIPWQGYCLIGTTEKEATFEEFPKAKQKDINYLLKHINRYFNININKDEITSIFCGLRPLLKVEKNQDSSSLVREHRIFKSNSNLITIAGGKWTTYRKMAEQTLDYIVKENQLPYKKDSITKEFKINGSQKNLNLEDLKEFTVDIKIKESLLSLYGCEAYDILKISDKSSMQRLHPKFDFIEAELLYSIKNEFVIKPNDFIKRRIYLGRVDTACAKEILARVVELMKKEFEWSDNRTLKEYKEALGELNELL